MWESSKKYVFDMKDKRNRRKKKNNVYVQCFDRKKVLVICNKLLYHPSSQKKKKNPRMTMNKFHYFQIWIETLSQT